MVMRRVEVKRSSICCYDWIGALEQEELVVKLETVLEIFLFSTFSMTHINLIGIVKNLL